jgi:hypothetical protein
MDVRLWDRIIGRCPITDGIERAGTSTVKSDYQHDVKQKRLSPTQRRITNFYVKQRLWVGRNVREDRLCLTVDPALRANDQA